MESKVQRWTLKESRDANTVETVVDDLVNLMKTTIDNAFGQAVIRVDQDDSTTDSPVSVFFMNLRCLVDYMARRMKISPAEFHRREMRLRRSARISDKTELEAKVLKQALEIQRTDHETFIVKLYSDLKKRWEEANDVRIKVENEAKSIEHESATKMTRIYKESAEKQEELQAKVLMAEEKLKKIRERNIRAEKCHLLDRCQIETELVDFLSKYDTDIGDRQREMENLQIEYVTLKAERQNLEDKMVELRLMYNELQEEVAECQLKILNEKLNKFARNRAARTIQKAWRQYWERNCAKKKKRHRKKQT